MASTDALPIPRKNVAFRVTFPIWDADGDLVTGAAGLDSEISKDAGTFADCTNEATEIATASGMYYLDLTNTEMNADTVAIIVKTSSTGAKTTPIILYPQESTDIQVLVNEILGTSVSGIEATAAEHSIATLILMALEMSISGTTMTIKRTNGSTTHFTKTLTATAGVDPITAIT